MTDVEALYRVILTNPDDDTLRLVYADALQEAGDEPRAAFIRWQVELHSLPDYEPHAIHLRYHEQNNRAFAGQWLTSLPALPSGIQWSRDAFRRGLPSAITAEDGTAFSVHADELFSQYPIDSLELKVARVADTAQLGACPWLKRLRHLCFTQGAGGQAVSRLLNSEYFDGLLSLHLGSELTTQSAVRSLATSRVFASLSSLSVRADRPGSGSIVSLLTTMPQPPRLRKLDLAGNRLTTPLLAALVTSAAVAHVEELDLCDNNLGAAGTTALARGVLPQLRALHLLRTRPTVEGVTAIAGAAFLAELRSLALGGNNLNPEAVRVIASAPATKLTILDIHDNRLGDRAVSHLTAAGALPGLLTLDLAESQLTDVSAESILASPLAERLAYLNLYGNSITPATARRLRQHFRTRVFL